jgi:hypothetical protein
MSEPMTWCDVCLRSRSPYLHDNGRGCDSPPVKAQTYLKKTCRIAGKPCKFSYRAGFKLVSGYTGQGDSR